MKAKNIKRYFAFCGEIYYPNRAMGDFVGDFDTQEEAEFFIKLKIPETTEYGNDFWAIIWDSVNKTIVFEYEC